MSPLKAIPALWSRRLVPAVVLAAAAILSGSAFLDPATACAKPFNAAGYKACADQVVEDNKKGMYTEEQFALLIQGCCSLAGGVWNDKTISCDAPAAQPAQTQPGVAPPPEGATQNPEPSPPVTRVPLGPITETFMPAPVG